MTDAYRREGTYALPATVNSVNGMLIRLTAERWAHILEEHPELTGLKPDVLESISNPDRVVAGNADEILAIKEHEPGKWLVVVYKEFNDDGFIITAFSTSKTAWLRRKRQLWP